MRKNLLEYDDVANDQRRVIYSQRNELMEADDIQDTIESIRAEVFDGLFARFIPPGSVDDMWEPEGLEKALEGDFGIDAPVRQWLEEDDDLDEEGLHKRVMDAVESHYQAKEEMTGSEVMRQF